MERERALGSIDDLVDAESEQGTLAVLARAEINQQIATAKAYPRSITEFAREAEQLATMNGDMARQCVYALPRGGKTIEGPSARFAEIIAYSFRNMRFGARPVLEEGEYITSQGVAYDLERNNGTTIEVRRRITNSSGDRFNADMIGVTANAANSIALRNAVLKIIPKAIWDPIYQKARHVIMGDYKTFNERLSKVFEEFQRYGATKEMVCTKLGKKGVADVKIEDMVTLAGMITALKEGDMTLEEMFKQEPGEQITQPQRREPQQQTQSNDERGTDLERGKREEADAKRAAEEVERLEREKREREEADAKAKNKKPKARPEAPAATQGANVTPNMIKQIELRLESYGADKNKLLGEFGITKLEELPLASVEKALDWIEKNGTE